MKAVIVYDSQYGNTEKIAAAIAGAFGDDGRLLRVGELTPAELDSCDVLFVGSPTQGGRPTQAIMTFLSALPSNELRGFQAAAFDTRVAVKERGFALRLLMRIIGFAATRIASKLQAAGASLLAPAEGFIVEGTKGPLRQYEIERAAAWAEALRSSPTKATNASP